MGYFIFFSFLYVSVCGSSVVQKFAQTPSTAGSEGAAAPSAGGSAALQKCIYPKNKYMKKNTLKVNQKNESL